MTASYLHDDFDRPYSPFELILEAANFQFPFSDETLQYGLQNADKLMKQIALYELTGDYQAAFLIACRHNIVVRRVIQRHPHYWSPRSQPERIRLNANVKFCLAKVDELRPYLANAYGEYRRSPAAFAYPTPTSQIEAVCEIANESTSVSEQHENVSNHHLEDGKPQIYPQREPSEQRDNTSSPYFQDSKPLCTDDQYVIPTCEHISPYEQNTELQSAPLPRLFSPPPHPSIGIRPMHIPLRLVIDFAAAVEENTKNHIETCGILAGMFHDDAWHITHIAIFEQTGTSVTCGETDSGSDQLLQFFQRTELSLCGWIHTHPKHTCFLSSIDLHTQVAYQRENQSAIAIVVDPYQMGGKQWDAYRVTDLGLDVIGNCTGRSGAFHPHGVHAPIDLYESALGGTGHCEVVQDPGGEVVDLR